MIKLKKKIQIIISIICLLHISLFSQTYKIVDTGQVKCFNNSESISAPSAGSDFYGQDAQFNGHQPSYTTSNDGLTVLDNVTGLTWMRDADLDGDGDIDSNDKKTYSAAQSVANTLNAQNYGGYSDWRVPSVKELYSLIDFSGKDQMSDDVSTAIPFIDTDTFLFAYGDTDAGERAIDSQWVTTSIYAGSVMNNQQAMFGVNFADGRIKGYGLGSMGPNGEKTFYVRLCRGNTDYGINNFSDNGDGTITDEATELMWMQDDCGPQLTSHNSTGATGPRSGMIWQEALAWVQDKNSANYLGYNDWRLPNAKELQSIVDYSRAPDNGLAAIDPIFNITQITNEAGQTDYPWFWTSTTHAKNTNVSMGPSTSEGNSAAYVCFGRALGIVNNSWIDIHGAGAQRSDQKEGNMSSYSYTSDGYYLGAPGSTLDDALRSYNYVRLVRDAGTTTDVQNNFGMAPSSFSLEQNYPNPFNPFTSIAYTLPNTTQFKIEVFNMQGQRVKILMTGVQSAGTYEATWDGTDENGMSVTSGIYIYQLMTGNQRLVKKMNLLK